MDRKTFSTTIKALCRRAPFRPFTIKLVSGAQHRVDRPEHLGVRDGTAVFLAPGGVPVIFDHTGVSHIVGDLPTDTANTSAVAPDHVAE